MAEFNMVMSQTDISSLKDALCAQQQLLQRLYNELDAEREASASAASEALSVILRLQGEKAAIKMEAEQYKRLAEEKMCHAEESFAIIEDIIYQKEMEIATLDYQVQSYRYKLLSMGCVDPGVGELKYPENLLQRNEALSETSVHSIGRRNSAPLLSKYKKSMIERESSTSLEIDSISKIVEEEIGQEINEHESELGISNWDRIKKLDERVKEIAGDNYTNFKNETRSPSPLLRIGSLCESNKIVKRSENLLKNSASLDYPCSTDVFEVPQVERNLIRKDKKKTAFEGREDIVHPEAVKLYAKEDPDWLKELLQSTRRENNLCGPSDMGSVNCRFAVDQSSSSGSVTKPRLNQLNRTSEIVGVEGANREEEMKLLNEIKEQLTSLQNDIRHLNVKKLPMKEEPSLCPLLSEAMLYFWL
ncbi:hypothetical protein ACJIZ3_020691 [Penstemon smallii]|uniref:GTD-binding domain-containing protein n=1 Tax=Penstemon smallii TaxID=265156 RepID=A0ABD3SK50_9LAMI